MKKQQWIVFLLLALLLSFFFFPDTCFKGAKNGLNLWFFTIIPSLLPFLIVSNLILHLNLLCYLTPILAPVFKKFFPVSEAGCYPILIGMLSGYPMGAKACADLVRNKSISKNEGQHLLSFVNNASPMFITSFIATQSLALPSLSYIFYGIILTSSYLCNILSWIFFFRREVPGTYTQSPKKASSSTQKVNMAAALDSSILNSFITITKIGGFIILFSILGEFVLLLPDTLSMFRYLLLCMVEITTAIHFVSQSPYSVQTKIILTLATTTFGGLSGLFQTQSVIAGSGLSLKHYILTKLLQTLLVLFEIFLLKQTGILSFSM